MKTYNDLDRLNLRKAQKSQIFIIKWLGIFLVSGLVLTSALYTEIRMVEVVLTVPLVICFILTMIIAPMVLGLSQLYHAFKLGFVNGRSYFKWHTLFAFLYFIGLIAELAVLPLSYTLEKNLGSTIAGSIAVGVPAVLALSFIYVVFFHFRTQKP